MDISDLIDREDPGIALLRDWAVRVDAHPTMFLERDPDLAERTLLHIGVSTRSILGAIVFETGGVSVAGGLIRLWGSGRKRSLLGANQAAATAAGRELPDTLLFGDDAFGGLFALNGGCFGAKARGEVFHLPADDQCWGSLDIGHSDFVAWCLGGDLDLLYGANTYAGRMGRNSKPAFDHVLAAFPFAWTPEGQADDISIRQIDADEHLRLRIEMSGFETE